MNEPCCSHDIDDPGCPIDNLPGTEIKIPFKHIVTFDNKPSNLTYKQAKISQIVRQDCLLLLSDDVTLWKHDECLTFELNVNDEIRTFKHYFSVDSQFARMIVNCPHYNPKDFEYVELNYSDYKVTFTLRNLSCKSIVYWGNEFIVMLYPFY